MRSPTAPYHEGFVAATIQKICSDEGLKLEIDKFGNLLAKLQSAPKEKPLILAAHMDHPGFDIQTLGDNSTTITSKFLGGVGDGYFRKGAKLLLHPGAIPATLSRVL
ncbi:MAG: hypothetical protein ACO1QB_17350, partial [Verrucomicrobiales bacterium]